MRLLSTVGKHSLEPALARKNGYDNDDVESSTATMMMVTMMAIMTTMTMMTTKTMTTT